MSFPTRRAMMGPTVDNIVVPDVTCTICADVIGGPTSENAQPTYIAACGHLFHSSCARSLPIMPGQRVLRCPICRAVSFGDVNVGAAIELDIISDAQELSMNRIWAGFAIRAYTAPPGRETAYTVAFEVARNRSSAAWGRVGKYEAADLQSYINGAAYVASIAAVAVADMYVGTTSRFLTRIAAGASRPDARSWITVTISRSVAGEGLFVLGGKSFGHPPRGRPAPLSTPSAILAKAHFFSQLREVAGAFDPHLTYVSDSIWYKDPRETYQYDVGTPLHRGANTLEAWQTWLNAVHPPEVQAPAAR